MEYEALVAADHRLRSFFIEVPLHEAKYSTGFVVMYVLSLGSM